MGERHHPARSHQEKKLEWLKCHNSLPYFIYNYGYIYDAGEGEWIKFKLWSSQFSIIEEIVNNLLVVILKARQLGLTWLVLFLALWLMLFHSASEVLLFSRRDTEAVAMLNDRLKKMYERLPPFLKARSIVTDNDHVFELSNGSVARAFPTTAGDSYTATLAIVDEADLVEDLNLLMRAVKPTIDAGGRMVLLSRSNKKKPKSEFKNIYRAAKKNLNGWKSIFLAWNSRPDRDKAWYEAQRKEIYHRTGSLDDLYEQYPETDSEALSPRTLDKRLAPHWINQCYFQLEPLEDSSIPAIPGLIVYKLPTPDGEYVIGVDPAEGNPTSDDSALVVLDKSNGEECAKLNGKIQPSVLAGHADTIGTFYNKAGVMFERNNHGAACLLWMRDNSDLTVLLGHDDKEGWMSSTKGKKLLYNTCADSFRDVNTILHSEDIHYQLTSIEGSTLLAPEGEQDDLADAYALALCARTAKEAGGDIQTGSTELWRG